ncbi:MAG: hypothetical protein RL885_28075 [Planctomycetota bacterium]
MTQDRRWLGALGLFIVVLSIPAEPTLAQAKRRAGAIDEPNPVLGEDPERAQEGWYGKLGGASYRRALQETGMWKACFEAPPPTAAATSWTSLGPKGDLAGAPYNGRVSGIQLIPNAPLGYRVFVGACSGGLWSSSSTSLGAWTALGDGLPNPSVRAFHVDPADPNWVVVGTGDYGRCPGGGVFWSDDGGATWSEATLSGALADDPPTSFFRLMALPGISGRWVAASDRGVLVSTDRGQSWTVKLTGNCTDLVVDPTDSQMMYTARFGEGLFKSTSAGESWSPLTDPDFPPGNEWERSSLAICRTAPSNLALLVTNSLGVRGVYRSANGGASWDDVTGPLTGFGVGYIVHAQAIAVHPTDPQLIFVGGVKWARTSNGGASWTVESAPGHVDITQLHFSPQSGDDVLWVCNDGGVYQYSVTAETTQSVNGGSAGLAISQVWNGDADRQTIVAGLQDNGIVRSVDGGQSWTFLNGGDGNHVEIVDPEVSDFWFSAGRSPTPPSFRIFRYRGALREEVAHPGDNDGPLFYDRRRDLMLSASLNELVSRLQSGPANLSWATEVPDLQAGSYRVNRVFGSWVDGETLFVTYVDGSNADDLTICRRNESGWTVLHRENIVDGEIQTVLPSPLWKNECWITVLGGSPTAPRILHSVDDGESWEAVDGILRGFDIVRGLEVVPHDPRQLFAATDIGVFGTLDGGQNWEPFQTGLPLVECRDLRFIADDQHRGQHRLVVFTFGRGVFERIVPGPSLIYVDRSASGSEDGTFEHPFDTVAEGIAAAPPGGIVMIRSNNYLEPQVTTKSVTLVTYSGQSVIR